MFAPSLKCPLTTPCYETVVRRGHCSYMPSTPTPKTAQCDRWGFNEKATEALHQAAHTLAYNAKFPHSSFGRASVKLLSFRGLNDFRLTTLLKMAVLLMSARVNAYIYLYPDTL